MKTTKLKPRWQAPAHSPLPSAIGSAPPPSIPVSTRKTYQWRFPLGGKTATLHIAGESKLVTEDMEALIEIAGMFRASVVRGNRTTETDYEI